MESPTIDISLSDAVKYGLSHSNSRGENMLRWACLVLLFFGAQSAIQLFLISTHLSPKRLDDAGLDCQ